jgi:hypothetical protein
MIKLLVGSVKCTLGDLDDDGSIGEGQSLKIGSILIGNVSGFHGIEEKKLTGVGTSAPVTRSTGASR